MVGYYYINFSRCKIGTSLYAKSVGLGRGDSKNKNIADKKSHTLIVTPRNSGNLTGRHKATA